MLSEEERFVVLCSLEWIRFYSGLPGHGIPSQILAQVAERCISKPNGVQAGYFCDEETLEELCGCLIKVSPEKVSGKPSFEVLRVNFAHYTVREYVDAGGLLRDSAGQLATPERTMMQLPLKIVLEEALQLNHNMAGLQKMASTDSNTLLETMFADFNIFCTISALHALRYKASEIAQEGHLFRLAFGLFDPSSACFGSLCTVAHNVEDASNTFSNCEAFGQFWNVEFMKAGSPSAMQLLYLLTWIECHETALPLIKRFVEMYGIRQLTHERLRFQTYILLNQSADIHVVDGSIIEAAAQGISTVMSAFEQLLDLVEDLPDPSKLLCLYIGGASCRSNYRVLTRLLECGADSNFRNQRVTSLQIAVSRCSFVGVSTLLTAGADPNGAGNAVESPWEEQSVMSQFNHFLGASPLYIHRRGERLPSDTEVDEGEDSGDIEAILVEYGAKSFLRPESALILRN